MLFFLKSEPWKKHLYEHPHIDNHEGWNFIDGKRASHLLKKKVSLPEMMSLFGQTGYIRSS